MPLRMAHDPALLVVKLESLTLENVKIGSVKVPPAKAYPRHP